LVANCGLLFLFPPPAAADTPPPLPPAISPLKSEPDVNNLNLLDGEKNVGMPVALATPADARLTFDKVQNSAPYISGTINRSCVGADCNLMSSSWSAHLGGDTSESFQCTSDDICHSVKFTGADFDFGTHGVQAAGTAAFYAFNIVGSHSAPAGQAVTEQDYASAISYPDGEVISFTYQTGTNSLNPQPACVAPVAPDANCQGYYRPTRIDSNTGYYITITYQNAGTDASQTGWGSPSQAALYAPSGTLIRRIVYNSDGTIVDYGNNAVNTGGRTFTTTIGNYLGANVEQPQASVQLPGEASAELTLSRASNNGSLTDQLIGSVVRDGVTWTYTYLNPRTTASSGIGYDSVSVAGPNSGGQPITYAMFSGSDLPVGIDENIIHTRTDELGRVTTYSYDFANFGSRLSGVQYPEGNSVNILYNHCGDIVSQTRHAKAGSGLADVTETASYPTPQDGSSNLCPDVSYYLPTSHTDALGRVTSYAYNSDGQMTKELATADASAHQPLTLVTYANSASGISRKTLEQLCQSTSSTIGTAACSGNALTHTEYTYLNNTSLPQTVIQKDEGTGAVRTTTYSYDAGGRPAMVDGPLSGTDDALYFQYDSYGRKIWEVGQRGPNGLRIAKKYTYRDSDDKVTSVQTGTVSCISACDTASLALTLLQQTDTSYDSRRYPIREQTYKATAVYSVTDRSFLDRGLADCSSVRMNLASLPAASATAACSLGTQGSQGPDRITKNIYDNAGELLQVEKAFAVTGLQQNYATYTYTNNGKQQTVTDANGNKAQFVYDGFDRLYEWQFPSKTAPGTVNAADYEQYTYDGADNRTCLRKRDGSKLTYTYDNLNRMLSKVVAATSAGSCP
jgi:YD repeat-containing protein